MRRMENERFVRSRSLLGDAAFERLASVHVAVFGVGGVGGWCAEALLRTGVRRLTLIDDDTVAESNVNRQRQAKPSTVGMAKADVLRDLLLETVADAEITAITERYTPDAPERFDSLIGDCDFVIDAIDSVDCKAHLIRRCTSEPDVRRTVIFSSMGAALRTDPSKMRIAPFNKVCGDGLAKALRSRYKKAGCSLPKHLCVYSEEPPHAGTGTAKGSIMPVTCSFGMALASLVIRTVSEQAS